MKDDPAFKKLVKKATKMPNAIKQTGCEPAEMKTLDGETLTLEHCWATNLHPVQFLWIFELFNDNMLEMYKRSNWGYEEESKKQELQATTARYMIIKDSKKKHVGYCHYRFVVDNNVPAVYCYELQVVAAYQKRGVGTLILDILVDLAKKTGMHKVMATVFAFNGLSLAFFHKNGFRLDSTTPTESSDQDFVILSRCVLPGKEPILVNKENAAMENDILNQLIQTSLGPKESADKADITKSIILKASAEAKKTAAAPKSEESST